MYAARIEYHQSTTDGGNRHLFWLQLIISGTASCVHTYILRKTMFRCFYTKKKARIIVKSIASSLPLESKKYPSKLKKSSTKKGHKNHILFRVPKLLDPVSNNYVYNIYLPTHLLVFLMEISNFHAWSYPIIINDLQPIVCHWQLWSINVMTSWYLVYSLIIVTVTLPRCICLRLFVRFKSLDLSKSLTSSKWSTLLSNKKYNIYKHGI